MAEQAFVIGPRDVIGAALIRRAQSDDAFRAELRRDPRGLVERELGLMLPKNLHIQLHEETPQVLHLVLPLSPAVVQDEIIASMDLGDREVQGFADKSDPSQDSGNFRLAGSTDIPTN